MRTAVGDIKPWPLRFLLGAPTVLAGLLVWTTVSQLTRAQSENAKLAEQSGRLSRDVESLERKWTPEEARALKARHDESISTFQGGNQTVSTWVQQANDRAVLLALTIAPTFGVPAVRSVGGETVTLVPATLEVRPLPGDTTGLIPLQRLLDLCLYLSTMTNRADLMNLSVTGSSNALAKATVSFGLWTKETAP